MTSHYAAKRNQRQDIFAADKKPLEQWFSKSELQPQVGLRRGFSAGSQHILQT